MLTDRLPRVRLGHLPTPLHELPRLSKALGGPRLLVKRDDQTGLAGGGNKTRKLEFSVAEALRRGADTLVTLGAVQSNHARQTAAAAAACGLRCVIVLRGHAPPVATGNLLLDHLLGARIVFSGERAHEQVAEDVMAAETAEGHRPYLIPVREAIQLAARQEGILLDPVYTGRAMAGLIDLVRRGEFGADETIVFWHTGGTPALFAYSEELLASR